MQSAKKREIEWKRRERRRKRRRRRKIKGRGRIDSPFGSIVKILKIIARRVIYCRLPITELSRAPRLHWLIEPSDSLLIPSSFLRHSPYMCVSPARACDAILYFARAIKKKNATTSHLYGRSVQFAARYRVIPPLITRVYTQIINSRAQGKLSHRYIIYTCSECNLYYNSAKKVRNSAFFRFCSRANKKKGRGRWTAKGEIGAKLFPRGRVFFFLSLPRVVWRALFMKNSMSLLWFAILIVRAELRPRSSLLQSSRAEYIFCLLLLTLAYSNFPELRIQRVFLLSPRREKFYFGIITLTRRWGMKYALDSLRANIFYR